MRASHFSLLVIASIIISSCVPSAPPATPPPVEPTATAGSLPPAPASTPAATAEPATAEPATAEPGPSATPDELASGVIILRDLRTSLSKTDVVGFSRRSEFALRGLLDNSGDVERQEFVGAFRQMTARAATAGTWRSAGPTWIDGVYMPQGRVLGSGRINAIVVDPRDSNVVYLAAAAGGLWKTTDGGQTWKSLCDKQVPAFYGGIAMDPKDPDTLYALLGVFDGVESASYGYVASGILRTHDAGATWELIGADTFNAAAVSALLFDEDGTLYAASGQVGVHRTPPNQPEFGIFKSTDEGDT